MRPETRANLLRVVGLLVLVGAFLWLHLRTGGEGDASTHVDTWRGQTMGTTWSVKLAQPLDAEKARALSQAVDASLEAVEARMSNWRPDSEISRFNSQTSDAPFTASAELMEVMTIAKRVSLLSGGAFDVTVAPLVAAWGFGPGQRSRDAAAPNTQELEDIRRDVGHALIEVDPAHNTLRKTRPGVTADLSAVAKGWGVDQLAKTLETLGFVNYLVEIGGEVRVRGLRGDGQPWRVGIEQPDEDARAVAEAVSPGDAAVATSGTYRNFYDRPAGERVAHMIDPRTGRPTEHLLVSASVIQPDCATADALATALHVLGPDEGPALARREGLAALFMVAQSDGTLRRVATDAWESP